MKINFRRFWILIVLCLFCCIFTAKAQADASSQVKEALLLLQNQNFESAFVFSVLISEIFPDSTKIEILSDFPSGKTVFTFLSRKFDINRFSNAFQKT